MVYFYHQIPYNASELSTKNPIENNSKSRKKKSMLSIDLTLTVAYWCVPYAGSEKQAGGSIKTRSFGFHGIDVQCTMYSKIKRAPTKILNKILKVQITTNLKTLSKNDMMPITI